MPTLWGAFDPRANGLNALRLGLAAGVIVWHSFPVTGRDVTFWPVRQLLGEVFVDGFFAISGFLIAMSWIRDPRLASYLQARALRILPAFYVCLVLTALVFAPIAAWLGVGQASLADGLDYLRGNAGLRITVQSVGSTPAGVPLEGIWNGSLWTLFWEALCYLGIALVGLLGLLRRPRTTGLALFAGALLVRVASHALEIDHWLVSTGSRFALMFTAGVLLYVFADHVPLNRRLLAAAGAVVAASSVLPDYRLLAAPFLAYLMLGAGALLTHPRWNPRNDISYGTYVYAFPVQQGLAMAGLASLNVWLFMALSALGTLPLAAGSWWFIERPALRLRRRRPLGGTPAPAATSERG